MTAIRFSKRKGKQRTCTVAMHNSGNEVGRLVWVKKAREISLGPGCCPPRPTTGNKNSALAFELNTDCLRKVSFYFNQKIILIYFKRNNALVYPQFTHSSPVSACSKNWKWTLTGVLSLMMNLSKAPLSRKIRKHSGPLRRRLTSLVSSKDCLKVCSAVYHPFWLCVIRVRLR